MKNKMAVNSSSQEGENQIQQIYREEDIKEGDEIVVNYGATTNMEFLCPCCGREAVVTILIEHKNDQKKL